MKKLHKYNKKKINNSSNNLRFLNLNSNSNSSNSNSNNKIHKIIKIKINKKNKFLKKKMIQIIQSSNMMK